METRKTRGVGFIFYIILIAIIFVVVFAIRQNGKNAVNYTYEGFINDLADGKVKDVTISQNQEIPTGKITVKLSDDSKKNAYVNDVEDEKEKLKNELAEKERELAEQKNKKPFWKFW